jgi:hypothetical protein
MGAYLLQSTRIGKPILGVVIPSLVFVVSFVVTWILYKHFSKHSK